MGQGGEGGPLQGEGGGGRRRYLDGWVVGLPGGGQGTGGDGRRRGGLEAGQGEEEGKGGPLRRALRGGGGAGEGI